jgi:hypothetical protein
MFVLCSQYVLLLGGVLAPFHPPFTGWSLLIFGVVPFVRAPKAKAPGPGRFGAFVLALGEGDNPAPNHFAAISFGLVG